MRRSVGYRIGQIIYFALALFLCGAGLRSVLLQVFYPKIRAHESVPVAECENVIRTLSTALTSYEADRINGEEGASQASSERVFFDEWDQRYFASSLSCQERHREAYSALGRLRYSVEAGLAHHRHNQAVLVNEINSALSARTR